MASNGALITAARRHIEEAYLNHDREEQTYRELDLKSPATPETSESCQQLILMIPGMLSLRVLSLTGSCLKRSHLWLNVL